MAVIAIISAVVIAAAVILAVWGLWDWIAK